MIINIKDYSLQVDVCGDIAVNPTVVLVPAMCRPSSDYADLAKQLVNAGFATISVNTRGVHGSTGLFESLEIKDLANDILEIINYLKIDKIHIVGQAFGTRVARVFADRFPTRVKCSVSITMGGIEVPRLPYPSIALDMINEDKLDVPEFKDVIAKAYFAEGNSPDIWLSGWDRQAIWTYCMALARSPQEELLKAGNAPILIIQGTEDIFAPVSAGEKMKEKFGDRVTLVNILGAAHEVLHEQPEQVSVSLIQYLKSIENLSVIGADTSSSLKIEESKAAPSKNYRLGWSQAVTKYQERRSVKKFADFLLPHLKSEMVLLDCGCGIGNMTIEFAKILDKGHVYGIDISEKQIDLARERKQNQNVKNIDFNVGNIFSLDFPDESIDVVWSNTVFMHLQDSLGALKEIKRVLKKNGIIAICDADWDSDIMYPGYQIILGRNAINASLMRKAGANMAGRHNAGLLNQAGFAEVKGSAFVDYYSSKEDTKELAEFAIGLEWQNFSNGASEMSLKMREAAWLKWSEFPGSFFARTFCQAIGWKN